MQIEADEERDYVAKYKIDWMDINNTQTNRWVGVDR